MKEALNEFKDDILKALNELPKEDDFKKAFKESFEENNILTEESFTKMFSFKNIFKVFSLKRLFFK